MAAAATGSGTPPWRCAIARALLRARDPVDLVAKPCDTRTWLIHCACLWSSAGN